MSSYGKVMLLVCIFLVGIIVGLLIGLESNTYKTNKVLANELQTNDSNINKSLDTEYTSCGKLFIKKLLDEYSYTIYGEVCNEDNFCRIKHISLEDCLK